MPKRVPVNTVIVKRDGKSFAPPIGKPFDFTQSELDDINRLMPNAVRKIVNETLDEPVKAEASNGNRETKPVVRRGSRAANQDESSTDGAKTGAGEGSGESDL